MALLEFLTVNVTLYVPGMLYTTLGFCAVELAGLPPGNDHVLVVIEPVPADDWSVNCTLSGLFPDVGFAVNCATGFPEPPPIQFSAAATSIIPEPEAIVLEPLAKFWDVVFKQLNI